MSEMSIVCNKMDFHYFSSFANLMQMCTQKEGNTPTFIHPMSVRVFFLCTIWNIHTFICDADIFRIIITIKKTVKKLMQIYYTIGNLLGSALCCCAALLANKSNIRIIYLVVLVYLRFIRISGI